MSLACAPTRHAIVRVGQHAFDTGALRLEGAGEELADYVRNWVAAGRPFVVRRPCLDGAGRLCCGLPAPPADGKLRLSLSLDRRAIASLEPPPLLADCLPAAPEAWRAGLDALDARGTAAGIAPFRVFGSLAWQHLAKLAYLGPGSDVDLLAEARSRRQLPALLALFAAAEADGGLRLDVEIRLPGGACFSWREYAGLPRNILVKTDAGVFLADREVLVADLPA